MIQASTLALTHWPWHIGVRTLVALGRTCLNHLSTSRARLGIRCRVSRPLRRRRLFALLDPNSHAAQARKLREEFATFGSQVSYT